MSKSKVRANKRYTPPRVKNAGPDEEWQLAPGRWRVMVDVRVPVFVDQHPEAAQVIAHRVARSLENFDVRVWLVERVEPTSEGGV